MTTKKHSHQPHGVENKNGRTETAGQGHRVRLERKDMIVFERRLRDAVAGVIPFAGHSMHFPRASVDTAAKWIAEEKKLLLPLPDGIGGVLGVFVARSPDPGTIPRLMPLWPAIAALISDNLLQYKRGISDPVTGLFSRHYLLNRMELAIETLRDSARMAIFSSDTTAENTDAAASGKSRPQPLANRQDGGNELLHASVDEVFAEDGGSLRRSSLAMLVVRLAALRDVVREFGYQFADALMVPLADTLTKVCPEEALTARTGDSEFAVLLPVAGPRPCRELAAEIVRALGKVRLTHPLRGEPVGISASVGYILYPQDMTGSLFVRPGPEQARLALRKARLAAAVAGGGMPFSGRTDHDGVAGFGRILAEGGRVTEILPLSRVMVSLGSAMRAREGQRFSVWSNHYGKREARNGLLTGRPQGQLPLPDPLYKGEIMLMDIHSDRSQAEVVHYGDPNLEIAPGDYLILLPDAQDEPRQDLSGEMRPDPGTGLLRHGDFLAHWVEERDVCEAFAMILARLVPQNKSSTSNGGPIPDSTAMDDEALAAAPGDLPDALPERSMSDAARIFREGFGKRAIGGRYGLNSLIFFYPLVEEKTILSSCIKLSQKIAKRLNLKAAIGIAPHPYLDFRKADALDNCRKALEYAALLPGPQVGLFGSLALNISADKRFSQGDTFGAIREYQAALLADEKNGLAWNSLGVCFAGLGRHAEAERHFAQALQCDPNDALALYNLGYMRQSREDKEEARRLYEECLERRPDHLYALVRLGQLAENADAPDEARGFYERAAVLPGGAGLTRRHVARLCIHEGKTDEARELLHEALLHDPQDALALVLLAGIYLDEGEDPAMAASFARQSVSLMPQLKAGWLQLARALEVSGMDKEARQARMKAAG